MSINVNVEMSGEEIMIDNTDRAPAKLESPREENSPDPLEDYKNYYRAWVEAPDERSSQLANVAANYIAPRTIGPIHNREANAVARSSLPSMNQIDSAEDRLQREGIQKHGQGFQNTSVDRRNRRPNKLSKAKYKEIGMLQTALVPDVLTMQVPYFNSQQRERYRLTASGGILKDSLGKPLDTGEGSYLIVMDKSGRLYAGAPSDVRRHSSFLSGNPVAAAGLIQVEKGTVKKLINESGHYQVPSDYFAQLEKELKSQGLKFRPDATKGTPVRLTSAEIAKTLKNRLRGEPDIIEHSSSARNANSNAPIPTDKHKAGQTQRLYPMKPKWGWF